LVSQKLRTLIKKLHSVSQKVRTLVKQNPPKAIATIF